MTLTTILAQFRDDARHNATWARADEAAVLRVDPVYASLFSNPPPHSKPPSDALPPRDCNTYPSLRALHPT